MITIEDLKAAGATDTFIVAVMLRNEARQRLAHIERQRRYMSRKNDVADVSDVITVKTVRKQHIADVLVPSPFPNKKNPPDPLKELTLTLSPYPETKLTRARARGIEAEAQPTPKDCAAAAKEGLGEEDFRKTWSHFRDHHLSKGSLMLDWEAAWRTWLARTKQFNGNGNGINVVPWQYRRDVGLGWDNIGDLANEQSRRDEIEKERRKRSPKYKMRKSPIWGEVWELKDGETDDGTDTCPANSTVLEGVFQTVQPRAAISSGRG